MKKLYELGRGDTFIYNGINWRIHEFIADHRKCRPTSDPDCGFHVLFHCDEEVMVYEW